MLPHNRKQLYLFVLSLGLLASLAGLFSSALLHPTYAQGTTQLQTATPTLVVTQPVITPPATANTPPRTVTVSGSGSVDAQPDIAYIDLGVTTDANTARDALTQNSTQMQALLKTLQTAGIANADIKTQTVQVFPRYSDQPQPLPAQPNNAQPSPTSTPNRVVGFTATNTVEVTIRKLDNLGQILDQAVSAGSNQVQGVRFDVANPSQVLDQAREAAMRDATHKAQQLATLSNAQLGMVITINENSNGPIPFAAGATMSRAAEAVPVSPGTQSISVNVTVTWLLQ